MEEESETIYAGSQEQYGDGDVGGNCCRLKSKENGKVGLCGYESDEK